MESTPAPSPPRGVSPMTGISLAYGVVLRQLVTPGRVIALTVLSLISTVSAFALGASDASLDDAVALLAGLGLGVVVPVVSLVFGGAAIGDLREDKTLVYLWLRPIDRWPIVVGAAAASATIAAPITLIPLTAGAALTGVGNSVTPATLLAGTIGVVAYTSLFTLFGVWLKRFIVWGLAYVLIVEGFVAQAGPGVARLALRSYTRSIVVEITGADLDLAEYSLVVGILVPLVVAVAALAVAAWRLGAMDID